MIGSRFFSFSFPLVSCVAKCRRDNGEKEREVCATIRACTYCPVIAPWAPRVCFGRLYDFGAPSSFEIDGQLHVNWKDSRSCFNVRRKQWSSFIRDGAQTRRDPIPDSPHNWRLFQSATIRRKLVCWNGFFFFFLFVWFHAPRLN